MYHWKKSSFGDSANTSAVSGDMTITNLFVKKHQSTGAMAVETVVAEQQ